MASSFIPLLSSAKTLRAVLLPDLPEGRAAVLRREIWGIVCMVAWSLRNCSCSRSFLGRS